MFGNEFAFAVSLLVAPLGTPIPELNGLEWLQVQSSLHRVAIDWQIMDPREKNHLVAREKDLATDIDRLRQRYRDLQGAPLIADSKRFPDKAIINRMIEENRAMRKSIGEKIHLETDRASGYRTAMRETDEIYRIWSTVQSAQCEFYYVDVRRKALKQLLEIIGEEAYAAAMLPPATPTWRFGGDR